MAKLNTTLLSATNITGSCLSFTISGCSCNSSNAAICRGIFVEGLTCNAALSIIGSCCLQDRENSTVVPCQNLTYCDCVSLANSFNFDLSWSIDPCDKSSCPNARNSVGACCDGHGICKELTQTDCEKQSYFFQGAGSRCEKDICINGTGGCCDGINCVDGVSGIDCISQQKNYFGQNTKCYKYTCTRDRLNCLDSIPNYHLRVGDLFEDGMVVGVYNPKGMSCWGNPIFGGGSNFDQLVSDQIVYASEYTSLYDYNGYGVVSNNVCDNESDSYIMIVSLYPASESITGIQQYTWSHGGYYYGPLIHISGQVVEPYTERLNKLNEGYVINTGFTLGINRNIIEENSISTCAKRSRTDTPIERVYNRITHNFNGRWSADWGIYNTIRMVNAQLYYERGISFDAYLYPSLYAPSGNFVSDMIPSTKPIITKNQSSTPIIDTTSSWFIPSINELSYLAYQCKYHGLNELLENRGGAPFFGEYWSSTGAFSYLNGEGYSNGITAPIGTYAWSIDFNTPNSVKKDQRLSRKKVRPIRLVRCDGKKLKDTKSSVIGVVNTI